MNRKLLAGTVKAQFKYAFLTGLHTRGAVFAVIFLMNLVFIILGSLGWLPFAAHITAVSLGGVAIAVMLAANIISDVAVARRMFAAPEAYLYALTPAPRRKTLLASLITMMTLDIVTMAVVITGEVWLSMNLAGRGLWRTIGDAIRRNIGAREALYIFWTILLLFVGYMLYMLIILFSVAAKKSVFFKLPASGLLAFLLACGCFFAVNLSQFLFAPFGTVWRYGIFFTITVSNAAMPAYILLLLLQATGLFVLTSKLMERKMNI
jgi:hypothetical protein